ncbi:MAG: choice-of-anchor Q domain-containing protein, partial [Anaerolineales bacterium]
GGEVTLIDSDVSENRADDHGGGIRNRGLLTIQNSVFSFNQADNRGGGIYNQGGELIVRDSEFTWNVADWGGGITNDFGASGAPFPTATIINVTAHDNDSNRGGGFIANFESTLSVRDSLLYSNEGENGGVVHAFSSDVTFVNNEWDRNVADNGGVLYIEGGQALITDNEFENNNALNGGVLYSTNAVSSGEGVTLTLRDNIWVFNQVSSNGGAIHQASGDMTILNDQITNNRAFNGGGILSFSGTLNIQGAQVSYNETRSSLTDGGGILALNTSLTLTDTEVAWNDSEGQGGGLWVSNSSLATAIVRSAIVGNDAQTEGGGMYITGNLNIEDSTIIGNTSRTSGGGIYTVNEMDLRGTTVDDNRAITGAGIYVLGNGPAYITNSTISNNVLETYGEPLVSGARAGGGIFSSSFSNLTIENSRITGNYSVDMSVFGSIAPRGGGGIFHSGTTLEIINTTIADNFDVAEGTGLYLMDGTTTIRDSRIENNRGGFSLTQGGGFFVNNAQLFLDNSIVNRNAARLGGGIYVQTGDVRIGNSTLDGNEAEFAGGGIYNEDNMRVESSTISGNQAGGFLGTGGGGGVYNDGPLTLVNSTVSGNQLTNAPTGTTGRGAGLNNNNSTMTLEHVTVAGNLGEVGVFQNVGSITLQNSLVSDHPAGDYGGGAPTLIGNNIVSDGSVSGALAGVASLGPLANNGGPTLTHLPNAGSIAINTADDSFCAPNDQRGVARPQDGRCNIGAVEGGQFISATLGFDPASLTVDESAGTVIADVVFTIAPGPSFNSVIEATVVDTRTGDALSGTDYAPFTPVPIMFDCSAVCAPGTQRQSISLDVLPDADSEPDETVILALTGIRGSVVITGPFTLTIQGDIPSVVTGGGAPGTPTDAISSTSPGVEVALADFADADFITKTASLSIVQPGDEVTFTITYRNPTDQPINNGVITDAFDDRFDSLTTVSVDVGVARLEGNTLTITEINLPPGSTGTAQINARVSERASPGDRIFNIAQLTFNPTYTASVMLTVLPGQLPATGERQAKPLGWLLGLSALGICLVWWLRRVGTKYLSPQ